MIDQTGDLGVTPHDRATVRAARVGLVLGGIGALLVVLDPFGLAIVGVVAGVLGALFALRYGWGHGWYYAVAGGAAFSAIARLLAEPHQTLGGWLAVLAALALLIGATLGYPTKEE